MAILDAREIQRVKEIMQQTTASYRSFIIVPIEWVSKEMAEHPEYFTMTKSGAMLWCGYEVHVYADEYKLN